MKLVLIIWSVCIILISTIKPSMASTKSDEKVADNKHLKSLELPAPKPQQIPYKIEYHGDTRVDNWFWLRDSDYPGEVDDKPVLDYLKAENKYFEEFKSQHQKFINTLFEEFKGRLEQSESSVPYQDNGFIYRWVYEKGDDYKTWYREPIKGGKEVVFLNEPKLAKGHKYFVLDNWAISPDNRYLAYSIDTAGDERYTVRIKDLTTGEMLPDEINDNNGDVEFSLDSKSLVYGHLEKDKWRTKSVNVHKLGDNPNNARVLFAEKDDRFFLSFEKTRDGKFFIIDTGHGSVDEVHAIDAALKNDLVLLASRKNKAKYHVQHAHGKFYILTNDKHINFRIVTVDSSNPNEEYWQEFVKGSDANYLKDFEVLSLFVAIKQYENGFEQLTVKGYDGAQFNASFPDDVFSFWFDYNPGFEQSHIRINYQSMVTPKTIYDFDISTKSLALKKQAKIPSGYDKSNYESVRIMAKARDGAKIPVTLMYKKGTKLTGSNPLHLYAYGAYGSGMPASFSGRRLSMVDRGVIYATAHIRGGDEMGYQWYLDGILEKRQNTFNDFVDVAKHLIEINYSAEGLISISGASAGGELMGAVINQAPELWSAVTLGVPFVDVLNTMLDPTLPLTPPEWSEWGNPITDPAAYQLIKSYSPYDNIESKRYPPMMVTGGLNDPRVTYWEPAKWTAKMRALKTDDNLLIMRMNMGAGHFANSGRFGRLKDYAEEMAFSLLSHGINK